MFRTLPFCFLTGAGLQNYAINGKIKINLTKVNGKRMDKLLIFDNDIKVTQKTKY